MLADPTYVREVDLSRFANSIAELDVHPRSYPSSRYLLLGLFVSALLHGFLFFWHIDSPVIDSSVLPKSAKRIYLTLNPIDVKSKEDVLLSAQPEKPLTTRDLAPVSVPPAPLPETAISSNEPPPPVQQARIITTLSRDEMQEIYHERRSTIAPQLKGSIAENVFNPALRERLIAEENKPDLQRADTELKTYSDPSSATIVDLGNGKCLRSSVVSRVGEVQNWYMTGCGGKSESERIMERINERVNGKLRFDE
jgi:hypothetical protein